MDCEEISQCPIFAEEVGDHADDATWILTSSFVILTMQSGFGLLEIGNVTSGNEVNVMLKNVVDVLFGALAFYFLGYGIAYGYPSNPFMGLGDFLPDGYNNSTINSGLQYSKYVFQLSFAATSTTIVSGCVAMRLKFYIYCIYSFYAVIIYSFVAHWFWADDGWLNQLGVHDFAGGGPVHLLGGLNGLIGIIMVGPRMGRFDGSRPASDFAEGSPTSMIFGLFMLWWGWIGFNCGSSFGISDEKWVVATRAGVNTINSSAAGGVVAMAYSHWHTGGKYLRPKDIVNGILGALVASTPTCASVHTYIALIIGTFGALIACITNDWVMLKKLKLDDPVGAVGIHVGGAIWGLCSVGLFADSSLPGITVRDGLFYGGGLTQLGIQLLAVVVVVAWSSLTVLPFFYLSGVAFGGTWRNPRKGLCHDFVNKRNYQVDSCVHDCLEDTTGKVLYEVGRMLRHESRKRGSLVLGMSMNGGLVHLDSSNIQDDPEVGDAVSTGSVQTADESRGVVAFKTSHEGGEGAGKHVECSPSADACENYARGRFQLFSSTRRI